MLGKKPTFSTLLKGTLAVLAFGIASVGYSQSCGHDHSTAGARPAVKINTKNKIAQRLVDQFNERGSKTCIPMAPMQTEFVYSGNVAYGSPITFSYNLITFEDSPNAKLEWTMPEGVRIVRNPVSLNNGEFVKDQPYSFTTQLVIDRPGTYKLSARVESGQPEFRYWSKRDFYIYADANGIRIESELPVPAEAGVEEMPAPAIATPADDARFEPSFLPKHWGTPHLLSEIENTGGVNTQAVDTTINGTFRYRNENGGTTAAYGTLVQAWDDDIFGDTLLAEAVVDVSGNWTLSFDNDVEGFPESGRADVYIVFRTENGAVGVRDYGGGAYTSTTGIEWPDITDGTKTAPGWYADWGTIGTSDNTERAFQVTDYMSRAWAYTNFDLGADCQKQWLEWRLGKNDVWPNYSRANNTQYIGDLDFDSEDVIYHEYGHGHMDWLYDNSDWPPGAGGAHSITGHYTEGLAMSEGYATYYSHGVENYDRMFTYEHPTAGYDFDSDANWDGEGSANGNSDDRSGTGGRTAGYTTESVVQAFLLDIADSRNSPTDLYDHMSLGGNEIYDVMQNYKPSGHNIYSIREFYDGWYSRNQPFRAKVNGQMMVHGMTQNRSTRPVIGIFSQGAWSGTWYRNGYGSANVTVKNYGSQTQNIPQLWTWLTGPAGEDNPVVSHLGLDTNINVAAEATHYMFKSQGHILPTHRVLGNHRIFYGWYAPDGGFYGLLPGESGTSEAIFKNVVADPDAPDFCNAQDEGNFSPTRNKLRVFAQADDYDGGILGYWVRIGTSAGSGNILDWTYTEALNQTSFDKTFDIPLQAAGTRVFAQVAARNTDGFDTFADTDGIFLGDATAGVINSVVDDGTTQSSLNSLHFVATGSDPESGIAAWWYRIYDQSNNVVRAWTRVVSSATTWDFTATGLTLVNGNTYFVEVSLENNAGFYSYRLSNGIRALVPQPLKGKVILPDTLENGKTIEIWLQDSNSLNWEQYLTPTINAAGDFAVDVSYFGPKYVYIRTNKHLWRSKLVNISGTGSTSSGSWTLVNGDIDRDNSITIFDYIDLSFAFDTVPGDARWDAQCDLDEDNAITVFDYIILSNNFGIDGDSG